MTIILFISKSDENIAPDLRSTGPLCIFREDSFVGLAIEDQLERNGISERHPDTIQQLVV
jgi:hypothetical protein